MDSVLKEAGNPKLGTYIDMRQTTVLEWLELRPIYIYYDRDTGSKGKGRRHELWWRKIEARKRLRAALEDI